MKEQAQISIHGLHKSFGSKKVLNGIDLEIYQSEIFFVIGQSGTGKSVLLKNITGLVKPDSGKIFIDSQDIFSLNDEAINKLRKKMGVLFQMSALFDSISVFENVAFILKRFTQKTENEIKDIVIQKLKLVGLENIENKMPLELSAGMQKRVGLARAIALDPEIIFYDEPTTGVDPLLAAAINDLIQKLNDELGATTIVVSHDMRSTLLIAHRVAMLHQGRFAMIGTPQEFKEASKPLIHRFVTGDSRLTDSNGQII